MSELGLGFHVGLSMRWARSCLYRQACRQINLPARLIAQAAKQILLKIAQAKVSFFFSRLKRDLLLNFCVCHKKKVYQENISFVKTIHKHVFIKGTTRKTNCYWHVHFFFDLHYAQNNNFEHALFLLHIVREQKQIFKKMDSNKKITVKLSRKVEI